MDLFKIKQKPKKNLCKELSIFTISVYPGLALGEMFYVNSQAPFIISNSQNIKFEFGIKIFKYLLSPYGWGGIISVFVLLNIFLNYVSGKYKKNGTEDEERNFTYSNKGTYGTSGWISDKERRSVLNLIKPEEIENNDEIILGTDKASGNVFTIPDNSKLNKHIAVYGASGTMKSRAFVRNYILQAVKRSPRIVLYNTAEKLYQPTKDSVKSEIVNLNLPVNQREDGSFVLPYISDEIIDRSLRNPMHELIPEIKELGYGMKKECGESMIITDPKGELFESMSPFLRRNGYDVKILDIKDANGMKHSDSWNCLAELEGDDLNAQIFADTIIKNTTSGKDNNSFWTLCEMNLLKALCLYVERSNDIPTRMGEVYNLITHRSPEELDRMFVELPLNDETQAAKAAYSVYQQAPDNTKGGVVIGLGSRLQVFQGQAVRDITDYNEINLRAPGKRKCAYFCITSDQQSAFDFLAALFYSMLFVKLVGFADTYGYQGKCWVPVNFILDEFPNIAAITDFTKKISTVRSRNINISVIFQNLAQLQNRYPYGQWEEILGNCDTHLFLGCTDETTADFVSTRTGVTTVGVSSEAKEKHVGVVLDPLQYRENSSIGKRNLLTPDEVLRIPSENELILLRGQKPLQCQKFDYSKHPDAVKLKNCKISEYEPKWQKEKMIPPGFRNLRNDDTDNTSREKPKETVSPKKHSSGKFAEDFIKTKVYK